MQLLRGSHIVEALVLNSGNIDLAYHLIINKIVKWHNSYTSVFNKYKKVILKSK